VSDTPSIKPQETGGGEAACGSLDVRPERLLQNWQGAHERACAYLEALGITGEDRSRIAWKAVARAATAEGALGSGNDAFRETLAQLREILPEEFPKRPMSAVVASDRFLAWRLHTSLFADSDEGSGADAIESWRGLLCSMPPLQRKPMLPNRIIRQGLRHAVVRVHKKVSNPAQTLPPDESGAPDRRTLRDRRRALAWPRVATRRRFLLAVLVLIPSVIASQFMLEVLPQQGQTWLEVAVACVFGALFGWISIGFWTALLGFFTLLRRRERFAITSTIEAGSGEIDPQARTAIVMPICEEPVERVFAGLKATYRSVERAGALAHFDFFILSDTADPGHWVKEEAAWFDWCREVAGFRRVFYRHRRNRVERKSGNVADFCRRWGGKYRYMIMLDADSIMAGDALVRLVQLMEANPNAGVIQTTPVAVNRNSLFARIQQFGSRVYGPMFAAGLHYWQLGDGQYWGHNAIIRVAPFTEHCALPRLPGRPPFGGEILSHDFVEAALMGRAGWELWLAFDLPGSYEETPSTLLEEMKRDRRWCQGNLQHLRLAFTRGMIGAHRALFLNGVLSYMSAFLWFCFLSLSTAEGIWQAVREPDYFPAAHSLFPEWPVFRPDWALSLAAVTAAILFLPKLLSLALVVLKWRNTRAYGGFTKLTLSVLFEILLSTLLAPIRMTFHTRFVITNLLGRTVSWQSQTREDAQTGWAEAIWHHGFDTVVATIWGLSVFSLSPESFWWLTPIVAALILSIPVSVLASRVSWGQRTRAWGLLRIPEETAPPPELRDLHSELEQAQRALARWPAAERDGFVRVAVNPRMNAIHYALLGETRSSKPSIREFRKVLLARVLAKGPNALNPSERRMVLYDADTVRDLHRGVWALAETEQAKLWGRPGAPVTP